jgi:hypothetical protein
MYILKLLKILDNPKKTTIIPSKKRDSFLKLPAPPPPCCPVTENFTNKNMNKNLTYTANRQKLTGQDMTQAYINKDKPGTPEVVTAPVVVNNRRPVGRPPATSPQPLPVEMLYFEGVGYETTNLLKWATSSEYNSNYFLIQRSIDGYEWRSVGQKGSAGNSNELIEYSYVDQFSNNSVVYYRLQQYDFDGQYKTYGPIVITNYQTDKKIVKYVNLLGQEVGSESKGVIIEIYDDGTMRKIIR